jgi:hypothetical protein
MAILCNNLLECILTIRQRCVDCGHGFRHALNSRSGVRARTCFRASWATLRCVSQQKFIAGFDSFNIVREIHLSLRCVVLLLDRNKNLILETGLKKEVSDAII